MRLQRTEADWLRGFLARTCSNELAPDKEYLFASRLGPVLRSFGLSSATQLVAELRRQPSGSLADAVVDAMTTNETSFFRDRSFFAALENELLPTLVRQRSAQRSLTIWSAASSTGQEVYSVAMLLRESFPELATWTVRFLATDVSSRALARARAGVYSDLEVERGLSPALRSRYLRRQGRQWVVASSILERVEFERVNLDGPWPALPSVDLLLLRNVLIYFSDRSRQRVLDRAAAQLSRGGAVVLGAQERLPEGSRLERLPGVAYPAFRAQPSLSSLLQTRPV